MSDEKSKFSMPEYEKFIAFIDEREKRMELEHYTEEERDFLWSEVFHKGDDVQEGVMTWLATGEVVNLKLDGITVPKGYFPGLTRDETLSVELLMRTFEMNYIAAAFTIDWVRREPRTAMLVLHRGVSPRSRVHREGVK